MKTLYIETATEKSCVALISEGEVHSVELPQGPKLSRTIALELKKLLQNEKPDRIVVGKGPGSLTGIRVGRSLAMALAFGWNVPLEEVCSLMSFVPENETNFAVLIDTRSGGIHVLTHSSKSEGLSLEDAKKKIEGIPYIASPHPDHIEKILGISCKQAQTNLKHLITNKLINI